MVVELNSNIIESTKVGYVMYQKVILVFLRVGTSVPP